MKQRTKVKKSGAGMLAACLMLSAMMPMSADAATHDALEDASSSTATLQMGKILTSNHAGKFPSTLKTVRYKLTAVKGFDNANERTDVSGKVLDAAELPMPAESASEDHKVTVNGTTAEITVGDFRTSDESTDTSTQRKRVTPVQITYDKAGYYVYKLTEEGSNPENIPGVTYDDHSYFVVVYVANCTDSDGNTVNGVYVHNITSYRNESGSETYPPDLSDIAGVTDNHGTLASNNTESILAKVGSSPSSDPDRLEAYRFWNNATVQDLVLTTNVTGNLGDRTKDFEFTVRLTGLEPSTVYTTDEAADGTGAATSENAVLVRAEKGAIQDRVIVSDEDGNATFLVRLSDDENLVLNGIPVSADYLVTEHASDHIASVVLTGSKSSPVIVKASDANEDSETALSTEEETVDRDDGTMTVQFINRRNLATVTGVPEATGPAALLAIAGAGIIASRRKRREQTVTDGTI